MGNTLRSTFGNLCGAEVAKDVDIDDGQKPVAKPKDIKKKDKKSKKSKKLKNGNLDEIKEENEVPESEAKNDDQPKIDESKNDEASKDGKTDAEVEQGTTPPSSDTKLTLKEQASDSNIAKANETTKPIEEEKEAVLEDDENEVTDVIEDTGDDDKNVKEEEEEEGDEGEPNTLEERRDTFSSDFSGDSKEMLVEDIGKKFDHIHSVVAITPEELSIGCADEIFARAASVYQPFVEKTNEFKGAVLDFERSVDPEKSTPDFEGCWNLYLELLDEENNRTLSPRTSSKSEADVCDVNANLQAIRAIGNELLHEIGEVRPAVENCLAEAGTVDVIEYVKGKMIEGQQLGITSKFSAPGKYRRNKEQLKKAIRKLDDVESDTKDILDAVESRLEVIAKASEKEVVDDEAVVPIEKSDEHDDDIFAKLETLPVVDKGDKQFDDESSKAATLLEQCKNIPERPATPTSVNQSYLIETIPESEPGTSPKGKTEVTQVVVQEEDHNTLDFGKYIFVDPTTGDIQVMRNRSRSLDSLVSMTSNRSSISRFGSFEFVTDFEINIAEKNQANMKS